MSVKTKYADHLPGFVLGLILSGCALWFFHAMYKWSAIVEVDPGIITIRKLFSQRTYISSEIESIDLTGRCNLGFLSSQKNTDATILTLTSKEKIVIPDILYTNAPEMKSTIEEVFNHLITVEPQVAPTGFISNSSNLHSYESQTFSGNPYTSLNGILLIGMLSFCVFAYIFIARDKSWRMILGMLYFISIFYFIFGWQMHYFIISNHSLTIKNHVWFWVNKTIDLSDIEEVVIETPHKRSTTLKIIQQNYKTRSYSAGTLRNNTWKDLIVTLQSLNIRVVNEVI